eukprot:TRINITY_DN19229_c0_g1_i1.p1 TRINITY_DN19229_c0_g1~~TRINITY_DN19229_c0_g1_i1.p1  ORF type:complete len:255 (-),score=38.82 TRINITY_DN19229_c0_g1_i1:56-820(-)
MPDACDGVVDHAVLFLKKRDGIDKALKIARYTSKLLLATRLKGSTTEFAKSLKSFETSVGVSRKAFRLGKFLQNVSELRNKSPTSLLSLLDILANAGEGCYYFIEQFVWLVKAGAIDKRHGPLLQKMSAWAELIGYVGSVTLKSLHLAALLEREAQLVEEVGLQAASIYEMSQQMPSRSSEDASLDLASLREALAEVELKRMLKGLALVQDLADALLALNDIREFEGVLGRSDVLAAAGLLSALISAHKNWISC